MFWMRNEPDAPFCAGSPSVKRIAFVCVLPLLKLVRYCTEEFVAFKRVVHVLPPFVLVSILQLEGDQLSLLNVMPAHDPYVKFLGGVVSVMVIVLPL